jgi:hypothetical protein
MRSPCCKRIDDKLTQDGPNRLMPYFVGQRTSQGSFLQIFPMTTKGAPTGIFVHTLDLHWPAWTANSFLFGSTT